MLDSGLSQNLICKEVHCSKRKVSAVKKQVDVSGKTYSNLLKLSDEELKALFYSNVAPVEEDKRKVALEILLPEIAKRLGHKHATVQYVYETYYRTETTDGYSYTQFKKHVKDYLDRNSLSMHHVHEPGEEWQIDFAGDPLYITDRKTGLSQKTAVLVCCMPFSNLIFMMALPNATTEWFYHGLNKGLEYMNALPQIAKSDNMKQWVTKSDRYSPVFSDANIEWCSYYGLTPTATRVRRPRDKGAVEGAVNQLYKYVYARIETTRFYSLDALNNRIWELLDEYNSLPYKNRSRWELFNEFERPRMRPLPETMYRFRMRKVVKLGKSYHVCVGPERHFYSVPYKYFNQKVKVMWDALYVEVYVGKECVCVHDRSHVNYGWSTEGAHMPDNHSAHNLYENRDANALISRSKRIGEPVQWAIEDILKKATFPQQAYGRCNAVMNLGKTYGYNRLNKACELLRSTAGTSSYGSLANILRNKRDMNQSDQGIISSTPYNDDVRGADEFASLLSNLLNSDDNE